MADLFDNFEIEHVVPSPKISNRSEPKQSHLKNIADILGGGLVGLAQGVSNTGANIAQFPSDIYTWATGKPGYKAPRPDLTQLGPQSDIGKQAEVGGEFIAPFLSPGLAAEAALGKAMYGGRMLPRIITDMLAGSAESENRPLGAAVGATLPLQGKIADWLINTPKTKYAATKRLNQAAEELGDKELGIPVHPEFATRLNWLSNSPALKQNKFDINNLLGEATKGTYPAYKNLQSELDTISRELVSPAPSASGLKGLIQKYIMPPQTTAAERSASRQLQELRKKYIENALTHLKGTGEGKGAQLEEKGREDYARYMQHKALKNALIGAALSGTGYHYLKPFVTGH